MGCFAFSSQVGQRSSGVSCGSAQWMHTRTGSSVCL
jgi:hypothetical protein